MPDFQPRDPDFEARVRASFARQSFMAAIGAEMIFVTPGEVHLCAQHREDLTQQHGLFHGGITAALADTAAGFAALTLFEPGKGVLTAEFKINLMAPALGETMIARGRVVRPGKSLTVCHSDVISARAGNETVVATALLTMMQVDSVKD